MPHKQVAHLIRGLSPLMPEFTDLVAAGVEIAASQLGIVRLETLSSTAGKLLMSKGVVPSVDEGIVLFHAALGEKRPSLRRVLKQFDQRAGRVPRVQASGFALVVHKLPVKRNPNGTIAAVTPHARAVLVRQAQVAQLSPRTVEIVKRINHDKKSARR